MDDAYGGLVKVTDRGGSHGTLAEYKCNGLRTMNTPRIAIHDGRSVVIALPNLATVHEILVFEKQRSWSHLQSNKYVIVIDLSPEDQLLRPIRIRVIWYYAGRLCTTDALVGGVSDCVQDVQETAIPLEPDDC